MPPPSVSVSSFIEVMNVYVIFVRNEPGTYLDFLSSPTFEQTWPRSFNDRQEFKDKYWQYHFTRARLDYNIKIQGTTRPAKRSLRGQQYDQVVAASGEPPWPYNQHNLDGSERKAQAESTSTSAEAAPDGERVPPNAPPESTKRKLQ